MRVQKLALLVWNRTRRIASRCKPKSLGAQPTCCMYNLQCLAVRRPRRRPVPIQVKGHGTLSTTARRMARHI